VLFDEFSQFGVDRQLFDVMTTSMGAQKEPLALVISTQAPEDVAVLSELIDYGQSVIKGDISDPTFHLTQYSVPPDADPFDESKWHLANPALGDFRSLDEMRNYAKRAQSLPTMMNAFRNLYLNQRVAMSATFVDEVTWARCAGQIDFDDLEGRSCTAGLDLSSKVDLSSFVLVFDGDPKIVLPIFWTPRDTMTERSKRDKVPYEKWADLGYIDAVPGNSVDFRFVASRIAELSSIYDIRAIGFDRWRVDVLKTWFDEYGIEIPMVPIGQGFKDGTLMVEHIENDLLNTSILHDNHPVLKWNAMNVKVIRDPSGNRKFDKSSRTARIDGFVALAMGSRVKDLTGEATTNKAPIIVI
jgi:phage terminase large subunit-like protein